MGETDQAHRAPSPADGSFAVSGAHTYTEEGTYATHVTVTDADSTQSVSTRSTATVADASIHVHAPAPPPATSPSDGAIASFTDDNRDGTATDFSTLIDCGDGTASDASATVKPNPSGGFDVIASHGYQTTGPYTATVGIRDQGGSHDSTSVKLLIFAYPTPTATFAIGDKEAIIGGQVTFWSSQWAMLNPLTTGAEVVPARVEL